MQHSHSVAESALNCRAVEKEDIETLLSLLVYFYGIHAQQAINYLDLGNVKFCYSRSTGRLRSIVQGSEELAFIRPSDFRLIPRLSMAIILQKVLPYPKSRVVVVNEIVDDILEGHTVFSKHVIGGDPTIRPGDEVLIVNEEDKLIGVGRALIGFEAMITAFMGPAVQIREKVRKDEKKGI